MSTGRKTRLRRHIWACDGGRCQLCGKRIDPDLPPEHPRTLTLDHIVPRSLGGTGVQTNLASR